MKKVKFAILTVVALTLVIIIGPLDSFSHGYYCDVTEWDLHIENVEAKYQELTEEGLVLQFTSMKKHFAGCLVRLQNIPDEGKMTVEVYDENDARIGNTMVSVSELSEDEWYRVYIDAEIKEGKNYKLHIAVCETKEFPMILLADEVMNAEEITSGQALIGFAYEESTFELQEKVLICILILAGWIFGCSILCEKEHRKSYLRKMAGYMALGILLTQAYMYNSLDNANDKEFRTFQKDSESLVTSVIEAERNGHWFSRESDLGYGLGSYNSDGGYLGAYTSQYGLQGKLFRHLARFMEYEDAILNLQLLCSMAMAITVLLIVWLIAKKYNNILAGSFLTTFLLSPWVVNFARNLYWVEFTWFLPMAVGLFCAWKIENRNCRLISYGMALISIVIKCLCGYEFVSTIMLGLIAFLLVDFCVAIAQKNMNRMKLLFRTIVIIGIMAIVGFLIAICMHAVLRGSGDVLAGIKIIFETDVLRRTSGADLNKFDPVYWRSFNASAWEVVCKYFDFSTQVITGIPGNLFPLFCIVPLAIFVQDMKRQRIDYEAVSMYVVFFVAAISWMVLAKAHACIHTNLVYGLWYFGYVQVCIYVIVNKFIQIIKHK